MGHLGTGHVKVRGWVMNQIDNSFPLVELVANLGQSLLQLITARDSKQFPQSKRRQISKATALDSPIICRWTSESRASQTWRWLLRQMRLIERNECMKALMEAVIGWHGGLQQPSHWLCPNITIGVVVWKAAHGLIKTTVDCACGNELEHQLQRWEVKVKGCLT